MDDRLKNRRTIKINLFLIYTLFFFSLLNNPRLNMYFNQKPSELSCSVRETRTNLMFFSMPLSVYILKVHCIAVWAKAKLFLDYLGILSLDKSILNGNFRLCKIISVVNFNNISKLSLTFIFITKFGDNLKLFQIPFFCLVFLHIQ